MLRQVVRRFACTSIVQYRFRIDNFQVALSLGWALVLYCNSSLSSRQQGWTGAIECRWTFWPQPGDNRELALMIVPFIIFGAFSAAVFWHERRIESSYINDRWYDPGLSLSMSMACGYIEAYSSFVREKL
jgi:hypothetical protein